MDNLSQQMGIANLKILGILALGLGLSMAKQKTFPQIGQFYHVYNRGNNRQLIFFERDNYLHFLRLIRQTLVTQGVEVVAYCLMPNHYHLLVYLHANKLTEAMKSLSLSYTKGVNKRFQRSGSLFQGRFQRILVTHTEHLVYLTRYIHLNPVKAQLVDRPQDWEFSSYLEYAGLRQGTLPQVEWVKGQIQGDRAYQLFLDDHHLPMNSTLMQLMLDE